MPGTTSPTSTSDVRSPTMCTSGGVITDPRNTAPTISASRIPNTRAMTSRGSARCTSVTASTSVVTLPIPETTMSPAATAGEETIASAANGTLVSSVVSASATSGRRAGEAVGKRDADEGAGTYRGGQQPEAGRTGVEELVGDEHQAHQGAAVDEVHDDDEEERRRDVAGRRDGTRARGQRRGERFAGMRLAGRGRALEAAHEDDRDREDRSIDREGELGSSRDQHRASGRGPGDERQRLDRGEQAVSRGEIARG